MSKVDAMLRERTGKDSRHWMKRIGDLISECARPIPGHPGLSRCDVWVWVGRLTLELAKEVEPRCTAGADNNIAVGNVLGALLSLWCQRIMRAKAFDPRRPVRQRCEALGRQQAWAEVLLACVTDDGMDHAYFPGQEWDDPRRPGARFTPDEVEKKRQRYARSIKRKKGKK